MSIDFASEKPIFIQIAQMIENDILRGSIQENDRALSTNEIAKAYNINPNTAAKGINLLYSEEILYKKRGIGMFVSPGAKEKILKKRKAEFSTEFIIPLIKEAKDIGISVDELVQLIQEEI